MMKKLTLIIAAMTMANAAYASDAYIRNGNIYNKENSWVAELGAGV